MPRPKAAVARSRRSLSSIQGQSRRSRDRLRVRRAEQFVAHGRERALVLLDQHLRRAERERARDSLRGLFLDSVQQPEPPLPREEFLLPRRPRALGDERGHRSLRGERAAVAIDDEDAAPAGLNAFEQYFVERSAVADETAVEQPARLHLRDAHSARVPEQAVEDGGGIGAGEFDQADAAFADRRQAAGERPAPGRRWAANRAQPLSVEDEVVGHVLAVRTILGHFLVERSLRVGLLAEERFVFLRRARRGSPRPSRSAAFESLIRLLYVSSYLNVGQARQLVLQAGHAV